VEVEIKVKRYIQKSNLADDEEAVTSVRAEAVTGAEQEASRTSKALDATEE
jgi:hypothetical protein